MKPRKICTRCNGKIRYGDPGRFHWSGVCNDCWTEDDAIKDADLSDKPRKKINKTAEMLKQRARLSSEARESLLRLQREANRDLR